MRGQKLTCTFFVGGKQVDKLTPEQTERMAQKVGEVLSIYYTAHHDEYKKMQSAECRIKN
jgi:hypothetical protein